MNDLLDYKLTAKQQQLIDVFENPESSKWSVKERCDKADITINTYYVYLKDQRFVNTLRMRNLGQVIAYSPLLVNRVIKDALSGKWMQQDATLRMSGLLPSNNQTSPLINVIINQNTAPKADIDRLILDKIIDILPIDTQAIDASA